MADMALAKNILSQAGIGGQAVSMALTGAKSFAGVVKKLVKDNRSKIIDGAKSVIENKDQIIDKGKKVVGDVFDLKTDPYNKMLNVVEDLGGDRETAVNVTKDIVSFDNPVKKITNVAEDLGYDKSSTLNVFNEVKDIGDDVADLKTDPVTKLKNIVNDVKDVGNAISDANAQKNVSAAPKVINEVVGARHVVQTVPIVRQTAVYDQTPVNKNVQNERLTLQGGVLTKDVSNKKQKETDTNNKVYFYEDMVGDQVRQLNAQTAQMKAINKAMNGQMAANTVNVVNGTVNKQMAANTVNVVNGVVNKQTESRRISSGKQTDKNVDVNQIVGKGLDLAKTFAAQQQQERVAE